jgi:hypothetical protein
LDGWVLKARGVYGKQDGRKGNRDDPTFDASCLGSLRMFSPFPPLKINNRKAERCLHSLRLNVEKKAKGRKTKVKKTKEKMINVVEKTIVLIQRMS